MVDNNDYYVIFKGTKLKKTQANRCGVGVFFGLFGIILTFVLPFEQYKIINYTIILSFVLIGYFVISPKIFKR